MGSHHQPCPTQTPFSIKKPRTRQPFHINLLVPSQNFVSTQYTVRWNMKCQTQSTFYDVRPQCCIIAKLQTVRILCGIISSFLSSMFREWSKTPTLIDAFYQNTLSIMQHQKGNPFGFSVISFPKKVCAPHSEREKINKQPHKEILCQITKT